MTRGGSDRRGEMAAGTRLGWLEGFRQLSIPAGVERRLIRGSPQGDVQ